ncbi:hypothetical protein FGB62_67g16 [Gracilaria domingensis]|nr:hypothetical protein FGB62_67g16 [Gracilaria domingensis]
MVNPNAATVAELARLESRLDINHAAQVELLQDVTSLRTQVDNTQVRDVSGDLRLLRRDVNSIMENLGTPDVFVTEYRAFVEKMRTDIGRIRSRLETLEDTIRMDEAVDAQFPQGNPSADEDHRS